MAAERGSGCQVACPTANTLTVSGPEVEVVSPPTRRRPNCAAQAARPEYSDSITSASAVARVESATRP